MEQRQLDDVDETFYGEEFIDEEDFIDAPKVAEEDEEVEVIKKSSKKKSSKKSDSEEEEVIAESKDANAIKEANFNKEKIKSDDIVIKKVKEDKVEAKPFDPWREDKKVEKKDNFWKYATIGMAILLIFSVFTNGFGFSNGITGGAIVNIDQVAEDSIEFINSNLLQPPFEAELIELEELDNIYRLKLSVAGQEIDSYATKDGKIFFPQGFDLTAEEVVAEEIEGIVEEETIEISIDDDAIKGNENALVTIVEFSDFECPFCGKYIAEVYPEIIENYVETGKVRYVFRDFPLSFHPDAQKAAEAAECAGEQGMYYDMHDILFANQDALDVESIKAYAEELELDMDEFEFCLDNDEMAEEVAADMEAGKAYGVSGTPAFFINGKMITGAQPYEVFEEAIEAALAALEEPVEEIIVEETEEVAVEEVEIPVEAEEEVVEEEILVEDITEEATAEEEVVVEEVEEVPVEASGDNVEFTINAKKWIFEPSTITVDAGDKVSLNILSTGLDFTFAIPELDVEAEVSGETLVEFVAEEAGTFEFECSSCEDWRGMNGELVVN